MSVIRGLGAERVYPERCRELERYRGGDCEADRDDEFDVAQTRLLADGVAGENKLLPEPSRSLAGELSGQLVHAAHPLDGDEEGLIPAKAGRPQLRYLAAQMVLELVDVNMIDRPAAQ